MKLQQHAMKICAHRPIAFLLYREPLTHGDANMVPVSVQGGDTNVKMH